MYNKRVLKKATDNLDKAKSPAKPKDIIVDPRGQWAHPGQPTRIPSNSITMQGVSYPVLAQPNVGQPQMMYPGMDYEFPGADYVDEFPQMQEGGTPYNYNPFVSNEPESLETARPFTPKRTNNDPEDYEQFLKYSETAPENRRPDENYFYGDPNNYDHYGMWDTLGKPKNFNEALEMNPDWQPDPYDGYYHGFSVNGNTGVFLKSGKPGMKPGDTTWMEIAGHYTSPRAQEDTPVFDEELGRFKYVPNDYIEADLTDEEIEEYRKGGYIVEDISVPELTKAQNGIVIEDPKEYAYRNQMYNDSLSLYNHSLKDKKWLQKQKPISKNRIGEGIYSGINWNNYINTQIPLRSKAYDRLKKFNKKAPTGKTTNFLVSGILSGKDDPRPMYSSHTYFTNFKKPVQPVYKSGEMPVDKSVSTNPNTEEFTKLPLLPIKTFDAPSNEIVPQTFPAQVRPEQANMAFRYRNQWQHAYDPSSGKFKTYGTKQATLPYGEKINEHQWEYNKSDELPESGHHVWQVGNKKYYNEEEAKAAAAQWDAEHSYQFKKGGSLPKAQLGKNTTLTMSPYSVNANAIPLASKVFGEYDPELLLGINQKLPSKDARFKHDVSLDLGLPYTGKFVPSAKANYHGAFVGGKPSESGLFPSVHSDLQLGYDPQQGLNFGIMANPRADFGNKEQGVYLRQNWPHGAWKGYAGILGGLGYRGRGFNQDVGVGDIGQEENKMAGRALLGYGANAGFEMRPFRHSPLRVGADASLVMSPTKTAGEVGYAENPVGYTPTVKAKLVYPLGVMRPKRKMGDEDIFINRRPIKPDDGMPDDGRPDNDIPPNDGNEPTKRIKGDRKKRDYEPISFFGDLPVGYLPGYDPETGREVPESYTRNAYEFGQGPTMYKKGGSKSKKYTRSLEGKNEVFDENKLFKKLKNQRKKIFNPRAKHYEEGGVIELDLTPQEIQEYAKNGYIVEDVSVPSLTKAQQGRVVENTNQVEIDGLLKQKAIELAAAKTAAQKKQVSDRFDRLLTDAGYRQQVTEQVKKQEPAKLVKKVIATSDRAAQIKKENLAKEKAEAEMYAAELAKNNGEIPYYEDLSKQNQIADNTLVDRSYLTPLAQQMQAANVQQDYNTKQQQEYYKAQLAKAKYAQERGFDNAYSYKYNPAGAFADKIRRTNEDYKGLLYYDNEGKPVFTKSGLQRQTDAFLDSHRSLASRMEMNDGALQGVDWMWTLPLAAPAALEGLGALASTTIPYSGGMTFGTAADAAFAIQGADQIYQGNKALRQANAMSDDTYEQKLAKLQAQNNAYSDIGLGAAGVLPLGLQANKFYKPGRFNNISNGRTASEITLTETPLQKFIGNTGATADRVAESTELSELANPLARLQEEQRTATSIADSNDLLTAKYKELAKAELNGDTSWADEFTLINRDDPFNYETAYTNANQNIPPAPRSNQMPPPPAGLLIDVPTRANAEVSRLIDKQQRLRAEYDDLGLDKYDDLADVPDKINQRAIQIENDLMAIDNSLNSARQQRIQQLSSTPENSPQVMGQINFSRITPSTTSTVIDPIDAVIDPVTELSNNPFPGIRGNNPASAVPLRRPVAHILQYNTTRDFNGNLITLRDRLASHDNPLNLINDIRNLSIQHNFERSTANDLLDAARAEIVNMPISGTQKKFFLQEAKRISNLPFTTVYTGSNKTKTELVKSLSNIPEEEIQNILVNNYGYSIEDTDNFADRYADNDVILNVAINQIYDDVNYVRKHGMMNPNAPAVNFKTNDVSKLLGRELELSESGVSKETEKVIKKTLYPEGERNTTGVVPFHDVEEKVIHTLKNNNVIPKTEELDNLIKHYTEALEKLNDGPLKTRIKQQLADYKSTKWLRTEYAQELKDAGLKPNQIEKASIISNSPKQKNLVDQYGNVIGTLNGDFSRTKAGTKGFEIASTGVNHKFHPYNLKHSEFSSWENAAEHLEHQLIADKLLSLTSEADRNNPIVLKNFRKQSKTEADAIIKQLQENNNNRYGEALYRAVHHGVKDIHGPVFTQQHFAPTDLMDPITKQNINRYRAKDYWNSQVKQVNEFGIPKAEFEPLPSGFDNEISKEAIIIRRKRGGDTSKLNKFTR